MSDLLDQDFVIAKVVQWGEAFEMDVKDEVPRPFRMSTGQCPLNLIIVKTLRSLFEDHSCGFRGDPLIKTQACSDREDLDIGRRSEFRRGCREKAGHGMLLDFLRKLTNAICPTPTSTRHGVLRSCPAAGRSAQSQVRRRLHLLSAGPLRPCRSLVTCQFYRIPRQDYPCSTDPWTRSTMPC